MSNNKAQTVVGGKERQANASAYLGFMQLERMGVNCKGHEEDAFECASSYAMIDARVVSLELSMLCLCRQRVAPRISVPS